MRAGLLREKITFQTKSTTTDGGGGRVVTWSDSFNDRARIRPLISDEQIYQEQNQQQNRYEITVRFRTTINRNMRITWGSKTLTIITDPVNIDERRKWLKVIARQE